MLGSGAYTLYGNTLFFLGLLAAAVFYVQELRRGGISDGNDTALRLLMVGDLALAVRIGWWVFAILLLPLAASEPWQTSGTYHQWFLDNRHYMTVPSSLAFIVSRVWLLAHLRGASTTSRTRILVGSLLAAAAVVLLEQSI